MSSPQPAQNVVLLFEQVRSYLDSECGIDEFNKIRLIRDIDKLIDRDKKSTMKSMIFTVSGESELAKELAIDALAYLDDPATITNALMVLIKNGYPNSALEQVNLLESYLDDVLFGPKFLRFLLSVPNIDYINRCIGVMKRSNMQDTSRNLFLRHSYTLKVVEKAKSMFGVDSSIYTRFSEIASKIAEEKRTYLDVTAIDIYPESDYVSMTYYVRENDISKVVDMNFLLADVIIENELDSMPIVARFEVSVNKSGINTLDLDEGTNGL